jgi:hypothetical protein
MTGVYNSEAINELETFFLGRNDLVNRWGNIVSSFMALPGLRGFWPMSAFDSSGNAQDQSGHAHHLTYNGNPTYNYTGLAPYIDLDGTGDYLARADEADLDIIGNESYMAVPGLTAGGWFWVDDKTASRMFINKDNPIGNQRSWQLTYVTGNEVRFIVSTNGLAVVTCTGADISEDAWYFLVGRFNPSTELKLWMNATTYTQAVGVPATLFNSNADLRIGMRGNTAIPLDGRASLCFLCAALLSDAQISSLYQQTRGVFGV